MSKNCFILFPTLFLILSCSSTEDPQKVLLKEALMTNMNTQIQINQIKSAEIKESLSPSAYTSNLALDAIKNMIKIKNKIFYETLNSEDFEINNKQNAIKEKNGRLKFPYSKEIIPTENLTIHEKIGLFNISFLLTNLLTEENSIYCGYSILRLRPFILPTKENESKILLSYFEPSPIESCRIIFHFKSGEVKEFNLVKNNIDNYPLTISLPKNKQVIAIEWNDSINGQKRKFTWPDYNPFPL